MSGRQALSDPPLLGPLLERARKRKGLTQLQVAQQAKVSTNTVYLLESGADSHVSTLLKVAHVVGVRVELHTEHLTS